LLARHPAPRAGAAREEPPLRDRHQPRRPPGGRGGGLRSRARRRLRRELPQGRRPRLALGLLHSGLGEGPLRSGAPRADRLRRPQPRHGRRVRRGPPDLLPQRAHLLRPLPPRSRRRALPRSARPPWLPRPGPAGDPHALTTRGRVLRARAGGAHLPEARMTTLSPDEPQHAAPRTTRILAPPPHDGAARDRSRVVRLLLVDDVEDNLLALEAVLARPGLALVRARSGAEALERLLVEDFALALVDVQMPEMDG